MLVATVLEAFAVLLVVDVLIVVEPVLVLLLDVEVCVEVVAALVEDELCEAVLEVAGKH